MWILKFVFEQVINLPILVSSFLKWQSRKSRGTNWWLLSAIVKIFLVPNHKFTQASLSNQKGFFFFKKKRRREKNAEKLKGGVLTYPWGFNQFYLPLPDTHIPSLNPIWVWGFVEILHIRVKNQKDPVYKYFL